MDKPKQTFTVTRLTNSLYSVRAIHDFLDISANFVHPNFKVNNSACGLVGMVIL